MYNFRSKEIYNLVDDKDYIVPGDDVDEDDYLSDSSDEIDYMDFEENFDYDDFEN